MKYLTGVQTGNAWARDRALAVAAGLNAAAAAEKKQREIMEKTAGFVTSQPCGAQAAIVSLRAKQIYNRHFDFLRTGHELFASFMQMTAAAAGE